MPYLYVCAKKREQGKEKIEEEKRNRDKVHLSESMVEALPRAREMKKDKEIYKYECVTERKCPRITDARVWSSV